MKKYLCLLAATAVLTVCSTGNASITNAWWHDDGDGGMVCTNWGFSGGGTSAGTLTMQGVQHSNPAHMLGWVDTTDTVDPTLTLGNSVNNDSGITWLGYQVNFIMNIPFTFYGSPTVDNPPASDWYLAGELAPTLQLNGTYEGTLYYTGPTPVGIGDELDYGYGVHFAGSTHYTFTEEAFAYMTQVPEPSALVLAGMGGLMLIGRWSRKTRKSA